MISKTFQDKTLPLLGAGMMRLPTINGVYANIDEPQTEKMISYAMEHGVNYFDTAWGYHDGNSELVAGKILSTYPRDSFYLATKFPGYDLSNMGKTEEIFEKQLQKCRVEYFDFYLVHNVCEKNIDAYLDESYGTFDYLREQKRNGRIKHLGFSAHGGYSVIKRFLEAYSEDIEFCQLQVNWLDWSFQETKKTAELVRSYHLPLWVMEPLRGGKLASLPTAHEALLQELRPYESIPSWAFRFLQSIPNVAIVLSGMSNMGQMKENITTFEKEDPLNANEMKVLHDIAQSMINEVALPCTNCRYCTNYCPQELDIPFLLELYNQRKLTGEGDFRASMALSSLPEEKQPQACAGCSSCEAVCPQQLKIADALSDFATMMQKD